MSRENWYKNVFQKVLDMSDDGFILVDKDGIILDINEKYCEFLKTTKKEAIGKSILQYIPNSKMIDIMDKKYTDEGAIHVYNKGTTLEKSVIVSRSYVEDKDGNIIAGVAQVKFKLATLDVTKKLLDQYSTLSYYKEQYQSLQRSSSGFDNVIGNDPVFERQKERATQISKTHFSVLLTGETGTGKEVFARAIHNSSNRCDYPMISINCAAIPNELLESELFGYEGGAFTGAKKAGKKGKFELANKGTLFLDEIGDMPLPMQAKLLRVLEEKSLDPLGSTKSIPIDIRLISATRKNLYEMVLDGSFREDLFYRINVVNLEMIPLRQRRDDILILSEFFLESLNKEYRKDVELSDEVKVCFYSYCWPGNVRELDNIIKSAYAVCNDKEIRLRDLPSRIVDYTVKNNDDFNLKMNYHNAIDNFDKSLIEKYLEKTSGNIKDASKIAGIHRSLFYKKIEKHSIDVEKFRM